MIVKLSDRYFFGMSLSLASPDDAVRLLEAAQQDIDQRWLAYRNMADRWAPAVGSSANLRQA